MQMSAIERIRERLAGHPHLSYQVEGQTITVDPATSDGFSVWLTEGGDELVVGFEGWHEHFTSEDEALNCFAFGLSGGCRLRIDYRGDFPYRWTVEARAGTGWRADSTTGVFLRPVLARKADHVPSQSGLTSGRSGCFRPASPSTSRSHASPSPAGRRCGGRSP
jgi:hypothetical protein